MSNYNVRTSFPSRSLGTSEGSLFSPLVERAIRIAADKHRGQLRKGSDLPYLAHPAAVALILARAGFNDDRVLAAAFLHDVVEDTDYTVEQLAADFPPEVVEIVNALSEQKTDAAGAKRPWKDRKLDHLAVIRNASSEAKAVALADKLHNLGTMLIDYREQGDSFWTRFNASRQEVIWYHREMIAAASADDERIADLQSACEEILDALHAPG
jgi:(p)ppGpp synthase/HD superfamily hydrolase